MEMSLRHNFSDVVHIVMATAESLELLCKHGNRMVYVDGLYKLLSQNDLQIVTITAPHLQNNIVCHISVSYFFLSLNFPWVGSF